MIKVLSNRKLYRKDWSELCVSIILVQTTLIIVLAYFMSIEGAIWTSIYLYCSLIPLLLGLLGHLGNVSWCVQFYHVFSIANALVSLFILLSMFGQTTFLHQGKIVGYSSLIFLSWKHNLAPTLMTVHHAISFMECIFGWSSIALLSLVSGFLGIGQMVQTFRDQCKIQSKPETFDLEDMEKVLNGSNKNARTSYLHSPFHKSRAHSKTIFSLVDPSEEKYYHHHKKDDIITMEQIKDGVRILHFYDLESGKSSYQSSANNSLDHIPILGSNINMFNNNYNYLNNWQWKQKMQRTSQTPAKHDFSTPRPTDTFNTSISNNERDLSVSFPQDPFELTNNLSRKTSPFRFTDSKAKDIQEDPNKKNNTPLFDASNELLYQQTPSIKDTPESNSAQQFEEVDMKTPPKSMNFQQVTI